jgi:hypothetical protein
MYQVIQSDLGNVIVIEDGGLRLSFGENPDNTDYQRYLAWVADGNTPEVIEP